MLRTQTQPCRPKKFLSGLSIALLLAFSVTSFYGCLTSSGDPDPGQTAFDANSFFGQPADLTALANSGATDVFSGSQAITAANGGVVVVDMLTGAHSFEVSAQALNQDVTISMRFKFIQGPNRLGLLYELKPDGLQFASPATLSFQASVLGLTGTSFGVYLYDPATGTWSFVRKVSPDATGLVQIPIDHFSMYGVS